jgi:hypothetical protein
LKGLLEERERGVRLNEKETERLSLKRIRKLLVSKSPPGRGQGWVLEDRRRSAKGLTCRG